MSENPAEYLNNDEEQPVKPEEPDTNTAGLEKELAEMKQKAEEYLANWQRSQADFTNYRRRNEQEKLDLGKYANFKLFCDILPVLDDLELAVSHIPEGHSKSDWVEGVRLVERKFKSILEKQGVKPVCALGMSFDPNLHEAIKQEKGKEGAVIAEVQKGYTLGEKLLRPSRVIVGSGEGFDATHPKKKGKEPDADEDSSGAPAEAPEK
jgi:molecular chaperone GrpE